MVGIFDLGSNSFISLVIDGREDIFEEVRVTKMAFSVREGKIDDCGIYRKIFLDMEKKLRKYTDNIYVFGTAVFREATNGDQCFQFIKGELPGRILDSSEEAIYSYRSVLWDEEISVKDPLVFDLGGGSLEVIESEGRFLSFPFGTGKVLQMMKESGFEATLTFLRKSFPSFSGTPVGIGGTFVTVAAFKEGKWDLRALHGSVIDLNLVESLIDEISFLSPQEIENLPFVPEGRGSTLLPGALITLAIVQKYGDLIVSRKGHRYALGWEIEWRARRDLNPRPPDPQSDALSS